MFVELKSLPSPFLVIHFYFSCELQEQRKKTIQGNTPIKMGKIRKTLISEEKEMVPLYTDTACNRDAGISTWEGMYNLLKKDNPRVMEVTATASSHSSSEATLEELSCSFLHRITARPKILP